MCVYWGGWGTSCLSVGHYSEVKWPPCVAFKGYHTPLHSNRSPPMCVRGSVYVDGFCLCVCVCLSKHQVMYVYSMSFTMAELTYFWTYQQSVLF